MDALLVDQIERHVMLGDVSIMPLYAVGAVFAGRRLLASAADPSRVASICDLPEIGVTVRRCSPGRP